MKAVPINPGAKAQPQEHLSAERRFLTIAEFSHIYGPCRTRVYQLLNSGEIKVVKSGRLTLVAVDEADAWAQRLPKYEPGAVVAHAKKA